MVTYIDVVVVGGGGAIVVVVVVVVVMTNIRVVSFSSSQNKQHILQHFVPSLERFPRVH